MNTLITPAQRQTCYAVLMDIMVMMMMTSMHKRLMMSRIIL